MGRLVIDTLCEQLADSNALVVLDNCEHVVEPCAEFDPGTPRSGSRGLGSSPEPRRPGRSRGADLASSIARRRPRRPPVRRTGHPGPPGFTAEGEDGDAWRRSACASTAPAGHRTCRRPVRMMSPARMPPPSTTASGSSPAAGDVVPRQQNPGAVRWREATTSSTTRESNGCAGCRWFAGASASKAGRARLRDASWISYTCWRSSPAWSTSPWCRPTLRGRRSLPPPGDHPGLRQGQASEAAESESPATATATHFLIAGGTG